MIITISGSGIYSTYIPDIPCAYIEWGRKHTGLRCDYRNESEKAKALWSDETKAELFGIGSTEQKQTRARARTHTQNLSMTQRIPTHFPFPAARRVERLCFGLLLCKVY